MRPGRPILRYHGGKWRLAPWIISHFPRHVVYHEPFCGAASILARKPRTRAEIINDLSGDIVNVFQVLRDPAAARRLIRLMRLTPFAEQEFLEGYEPTQEPIERARRTLVRSHMGHGATGCNPNRRTGFRARSHTRTRGRTSPQDWADLPDHIRHWVDRLTGVTITQRDAIPSLLRHDAPDTLHYVDPPYLDHTRSQEAKRDYEHPYSDDQHQQLSKVLHDLKGLIILSGYPSEEYDRWYQGWARVHRSALADRGKVAVECLWLNPAAVAAGAIRQPELFTREVA